MNTDFITLNSRITIRKDSLAEKKLKLNDEGFTRAIAFIALISFLVYCIYDIIYEREYLKIIQIILILIWLQPHFKRIYQAIFVNVWRAIIKLNEIKTITTEPLDNGLETKVVLHLNNGRQKKFIFRNAENQLERFLKAIELKTNESPTRSINQ